MFVSPDDDPVVKEVDNVIVGFTEDAKHVIKGSFVVYLSATNFLSLYLILVRFQRFIDAFVKIYIHSSSQVKSDEIRKLILKYFIKQRFEKIVSERISLSRFSSYLCIYDVYHFQLFEILTFYTHVLYV